MAAPEIATSSVFVDSEAVKSPVCHGFEFTAEGPIDYEAMFKSYLTSGFLASNLGMAIDNINHMFKLKFKPGDLYEDY